MIRFASIPKAASRTLQVFGLLGATTDRPHMPIREYPEWEKYDWHVIRRDSASWLASWWREAKRARAPFTEALGMRFENMAEDLAILDNPPVIPTLPPGEHLHAWIPANFSEAYAPYHGRFQDFCYATILDGVACKTIDIKDLDAWLIARDLPAHHVNRAVT